MSFIIENGVLEEYIPSGETDVVIPEGVTSIKKLVFYGLECQKIKSITLPRSLTIIERCTFDSCRYLQSVDIPDSVTKIEDYVFNGSGIQSIAIPNSVTSIGDHAFSWCKNLRSITIPESVTSIGNYAFENCGVREITIPDSVTHIGYGAFSNIKITFSSKGFQVSFFLKKWGLNIDERILARFYNAPIYYNFERIRLTCYKYPMALLRFFAHNEDEYQKYIKRNITKTSRYLIDENNCKIMNIVLDAGFVTKYGINKLINYSVKKKQTEMTALLLEYKNKHFGFTDINKRFRL